MPGQGISQATAVIVGQSLGAKDYDSASRTVTYGLITISAFIIPGMSLTFFYGNQFIRFFVNDPDVIAYGASLFRIVSISVVLFALFTVMAGAFQGGGDTKPIMGLNMFRLWGVRVPVALLLSRFLGFGPAGIWWAMFVSNLMVVIIICFLYRTDRWKYKLNPDTI
jgi:Na+-driven multidrug efflux pump